VATRADFYHSVYDGDAHKAAARYQEVTAASQRSPPLLWLALTQREKEMYLQEQQ
jgi:hypothetical protein